MKHVQRLISALLCIVIVCSFSVVVMGPLHTHAEDGNTEQTQTYSYMYEYFSHLDNYPWNLHASCGYISVAMLLSYYDNYWNDNLVPDDYEVDGFLNNNGFIHSSPGIAQEAGDGRLTVFSGEPYYQSMVLMSNDSLHAYLIILGEALRGEEAPYNYRLYPEDEAALFQLYFDTFNVPGETNPFPAESWDFTVVNYDRDDFQNYNDAQARAEVVSYLQQGIPVMVSLDYTDTSDGQRKGRHSAIAYDYAYVDDRTVIYVHTGMRGSWGLGVSVDLKHMDIDDTEEGILARLYAYSVLPFDHDLVPHVHSDGHLSQNGSSHCSCELYTHQHDYTYESIAIGADRELRHKNMCYCVDRPYLTEGHTFENIGLNKKKCVKCGIVLTVGSFIPIIKKIEPEEDEEIE